METKICNKCKIEKPTNEFIKNKSAKDGLTARCKSCIKEYRMKDDVKKKRKIYCKEYLNNLKSKNPNYWRLYPSKQNRKASSEDIEKLNILSKRPDILDKRKKKLKSNRNNLTDSYIKSTILRITKNIDVPNDIIEGTRLLIKIKNKIRILKAG